MSGKYQRPARLRLALLLMIFLCAVPFHAETGKLRGGAPTPLLPDDSSRAIPEPTAYSYNWEGLLAQSLEFNLMENAFRISSDPLMRNLLAHKPYWHDWIASMNHFNMNRWRDGDDFLVNYAGHTMQGSVAAYIEIQNSPTQSRIRWGDPGYGRSRLRGFLWSVVFSTHSEISPIGESGIGNEGGFTYGVQCMEKCTAANFHPGDKYTNNTGWIDFVITPTVGILWTVVEDVLDREISDRVQGDDQTRWEPKVLRGSLNPARSFANLLRWQVPWYRDWQEPLPEKRSVHFLQSDEETKRLRTLPRFSVSPHFTGFSIATNTPDCHNCRRMTTGAGIEVTARLYRWLGADMDISEQPDASPLPGDRAGGNMLAAFFGLSATKDTKNYAVRLAVRPGLVRFGRAWTSSPDTIILPSHLPGIPDVPPSKGSIVIVNSPPKIGPIHHFAWNVNLTGDYKLTQHLALRAGIGEDLIRYRTNQVDPPGIGTPPYQSWLSKQNFLNRGGWSYQLGPAFSF